MNRSHRRVATYVSLIGLLGVGTWASGQQGRLNGSQPRSEVPASRQGDPGVRRAANPPLLQVNDGWQRGEQPPRGAGIQRSPQQAGQRPPLNGPAAGAQVQPQPAPFTLTAQEEAKLDQILIAWEQQSRTIKTYKCEFDRYEYGTVFGQSPKDEKMARTKGAGELKYSTPDKGMFKVTSSEFYNPKTGEYEKAGLESLEHWVCDGQSVFEINHKEKTRTESRLPPEMRGTAISDGPLPFVFGAKAATLKQRYWMRDITPANVTDAIWLEAHPRFQADAANFKFVEIIIGKDFMPQAIKMYNPAYDPARGNDSTTVFVFKKASFNGALDNVFKDFVAPDVRFDYKKIILPSAGEQPTANNAPAPRIAPRSARAPAAGPTR